MRGSRDGGSGGRRPGTSPRPLRRFGQNFLTDPGVAARIVAALAPGEGEAVIEIGPGKGALTAGLLEAYDTVAALELDRRLVADLRKRFPAERLRLVEGDVIRVPFARLLEELDAPPGSRIAVVGNLPYNVSKPVAMKLVSERRTVARAVLMFQREVAARLTARPGTREYGPLTVLVGKCFRVRSLFNVAPSAFRPRPAVQSTVTSWTAIDTPFSSEEESRLRRCLTICFASRRRTVRNNLRAALRSDETADRVLVAAGVDGGSRAEQLEPAEFERLAAGLPEEPA